MTSERRDLLKDRVERIRKSQILWQELTLEAHNIDRDHGFSRKCGGDGIALNRQRLVPYYGQEDGKPFQNLLEWITEL